MTRRIASGVARGQGRAALQAVWRAVKGVPSCRRAEGVLFLLVPFSGKIAKIFSVNLVDVTRLALGLALVV